MIKIALVLIVYFINGCVITGPTRSERIAVSDLTYKFKISPLIEVEDKTEIVSHDFDYIDIKKTIENEAARQNDKLNEILPEARLKFTYFKCETIGHFPTNINGLNLFLRIISFGFIPTGDLKNCPSSLEVQNTKNGETISKYETSIEAKQGGSIIEYYMYMSEIKKTNRVLVPMKKLLLHYQGVIQKQTVEIDLRLQRTN
tara:strand:+ start:21244 stop:21846 length:603 start_codon:yes stop_codon:yes gene_type:complete